MKNKSYIVFIGALSILSACVHSPNNSAFFQANSEIESVTETTISIVDNQEQDTSEQEVKPEPEILELQRDHNGYPLKPAWTNYSNYAHADDEGYAYTMYNDPDISSEIIPIDGSVSSQDVLLFTFDDAPYEPDTYMLEMAELMKSKDVNAIFLVNGMFIETENHQREILRQVSDMGFEIGNHTQYHSNLTELSYEEQYAEIKQTNDLIEEITGEPVRWFRPPFGLYNMDTLVICNELGLQLMGWNFGYDWMDEYQDGNALANISLTTDYLRSGANILMHDRYWTLDALERMIDGYREQGYHIVDPYLIRHQMNDLEIHS